MERWRSVGALVCVFCLGVPPEVIAEERDVDEASPGSNADLLRVEVERAEQLLEQGQLDEVILALKAAYDRHRSPRLLVPLGRALARQGRADQARFYYRLYLTVEPGGAPEIKAEAEEWLRTHEQQRETPRPPAVEKQPVTVAEPRYLIGREGGAGAGAIASGAVVVGVGAALITISVPFLAMGATSGSEGRSIAIGGSALGLVTGILHLIPGALTLSKGINLRRDDPGKPIYATRAELDRKRRDARRLAIGGGVVTGVFAAFVVAGGGVIGEAKSRPPPTTGFGDGRLYDTGAVMAAIGGIGFVVSGIILSAGLAEWSRLGKIAREGPATATWLSPWVGGDSAGAAFGGTF